MANSHQGHFPDQRHGRGRLRRHRAVAQFPPNGYGLSRHGGQRLGVVSDWYRPDYYAQLAAGGVARNPRGPHAVRPLRARDQKRVHRGGSFLCTDQYCTRYMVGTRGKGEISTGTNHLGFRRVKTP